MEERYIKSSVDKKRERKVAGNSRRLHMNYAKVNSFGMGTLYVGIGMVYLFRWENNHGENSHRLHNYAKVNSFGMGTLYVGIAMVTPVQKLGITAITLCRNMHGYASVVKTHIGS